MSKVGQVQWEIENLEGVADVVADTAAAAVGGIAGIEFTVGASDTGTVDIQLLDHNGNPLETVGVLRGYLSDDAAGASMAAAAPSGGIAAGAEGVFSDDSGATAIFTVITNADGVANLIVTEAAADTWYMALILPNGRVAVSGAIVFTV